MYKKIAAGVMALALTLGSAALPAETFINTSGGSIISASADYSEGDFSYVVLSDNTAEISGYTGSDSTVAVPSKIGGKTVSSVGKSAFQNKRSLTSVTLPSTINNIGEQAFMYCTSLETVNIPDSVVSIGAKAFTHCQKLKSAVIPDNVKVIENDVFNWCESLEKVTLPNGITAIGNGAFTSCTSLTSLDIPSGVTSIGSSAFAYCRNLAKLSIPDNVTYVGSRAFQDNAWFKNLSDGLFYAGKVAYAYIGTMPDNTSINIKAGTALIADGAFKNCALSSVTIPSSVTEIGSQAFYKTSLTSVKIPNSVTVIGSEAFTSCEKLSEADIPSSVKSIGGQAFSWCTSLKSAVIPNGVTAVEKSTFSNCKALTSITIPDSVTSVGNSAFDGCTSLSSINIPSSIDTIGFAAFRYCPIKNMDIPDGVTKIEPNTFYGCSELTSVTIPDGVTSIGYSAFYNCQNLKNVTVPASVTTIGKEALGYYLDNSSNTKKTVSGFLISGSSGSAAESYANSNNLQFSNKGTDVEKTDIAKCSITLSKTTFDYTGSAIKPDVTVKYGSNTLINGKDYTVSYSNNVNAGTATVTISGKGLYKGSVSKTFTIVKKDEPVVKNISQCTIKLSGTSFNYTGKAVKPKVTITDGTRGLVLNTDYVIRYINNVNVGTASVKISGKGDYTGSVTKNFTITNSSTAISKCTITLNKSSFTFTGNPIKPRVTVKNGSKVLTSGTDYVIKYTNNTNPGTASIIIAGRGSYTGSVTKTFTITSDITKCNISLNKTSFKYTGKNVKPKVTVKDGNKTLVLNTDYAIRYVNNVNVGTASVVISGRNGYSGSVTKTFTIIK